MTGPSVQNVPLVQVYPDQSGGSRREKELFPSEHEELPRVADHGFKYFTSEDELKGRNTMVQKALSTRTATLSEMRTFRKHQLIHKFKTHEYDTGSGRVQGTERTILSAALCIIHFAQSHCSRTASLP